MVIIPLHPCSTNYGIRLVITKTFILATFPPATKGIPLNYDARTNTSDADRAAFIQWLTDQTVAQLQAARGNETAIHEAVKIYVKHALDAYLPFEEIEEVLGINEPCIMDLAELSEADEEAVVDAFEDLCNA